MRVLRLLVPPPCPGGAGFIPPATIICLTGRLKPPPTKSKPPVTLQLSVGAAFSPPAHSGGAPANSREASRASYRVRRRRLARAQTGDALAAAAGTALAAALAAGALALATRRRGRAR